MNLIWKIKLLESYYNPKEQQMEIYSKFYLFKTIKCLQKCIIWVINYGARMLYKNFQQQI